MQTKHPLVGTHVIVSAADTSVLAQGEILECYQTEFLFGSMHFIRVGNPSQLFSFAVPAKFVNEIAWKTEMGETVDHLEVHAAGNISFHFYKPKAI